MAFQNSRERERGERRERKRERGERAAFLISTLQKTDSCDSPISGARRNRVGCVCMFCSTKDNNNSNNSDIRATATTSYDQYSEDRSIATIVVWP